MKIALIGAGAIGGWLGVKLARAGNALSVLARGAALQAIQTQGLQLIEAGQTLVAQPVRVSAQATDLGPQDLVLLAVKAPALASVAPAVAQLLGPNTVVLSAMNGVPWWFFHRFGGALENTRLQTIDPQGQLAQAMPPAQVLGSVIHAACSLAAPGVAQRHFGQKLIVGEPGGGDSARLSQVCAVLSQAGLEIEVAQLIQRDVWYKLWGNMTVNPLSALTGATTDLILHDPLVRDFASAVMLEAKAIGVRLGLPIEQAPEDRHQVTLKLGAFKTSMLQDLEAGKALELDALLGVVRELGRRTAVATPMMDTLFGLARLQARVKGLYPGGGH